MDDLTKIGLFGFGAKILLKMFGPQETPPGQWRPGIWPREGSSFSDEEIGIVESIILEMEAESGKYVGEFFEERKLEIIRKLDERVDSLNEAKKKKDRDRNIGMSQADEIIKFKKLLDDGVLTQEEFDKKKKQILSL